MADKHIRLNAKFSAVSAFWKPNASDVVYTGTLKIDNRCIRFTTAPEYSRPISATTLSSAKRLIEGGQRIPVLHGFTEDGLCTLCQLVEVKQPGLTHFGLGQSIVATTYQASVCVNGMHLGGLNDKCINSARYSFCGLSEWLPEATSESWEKDCIVLKVPFTENEVFAIGLLGSRILVSLRVFPELTSIKSEVGRLSRSVPYIKIESPEAESLDWYHDIGNRLENFFSLLSGTSLALETMFVYRGEEDGSIIEKRHNKVERFNPFDCVRCTPSQLANSIAIWLSESQEFRSVENLALGVVRKGELFIETRFLSLAQALEGFHRATTQTVVADKAESRRVRRMITALLKTENVNADLAKRICDSMSHVNDPSFASRLTELCGRFSDSLLSGMKIEPTLFVRNVVDTRNFYTHAGSKTDARRRSIPLSGTDLFFLNQKMRALLRGLLLLHLMIPEEQLSELLVRDATRWR
jgi:hypothetical protein